MSKASSALILQGPHNWELWIYTVKRLAEAGDVWGYINPDLLHPAILSKPPQPTQIHAANEDGSPATEPTSEARAQHSQDMSLYYRELKEYRRIKDKIGQIEAHIANTIAQDLVYQIKDQESLHHQLKTL